MNSSKNTSQTNPPMPDRETLSQWLDERASGRLDPAHLQALESCLAADPSLAQDAQFAQRLELLMRDAKVDVRPGFLEAVMARVQGVERTAPIKAWRLVAAALVVNAGRCSPVRRLRRLVEWTVAARCHGRLLRHLGCCSSWAAGSFMGGPVDQRRGLGTSLGSEHDRVRRHGGGAQPVALQPGSLQTPRSRHRL